jgi:hypothetical protein
MAAGTAPAPAAAEDEDEAVDGELELGVPPLPDEELLHAARVDTATKASAPTSHRRRLVEDFISRISLVIPRHRWDGPGLRDDAAARADVVVLDPPRCLGDGGCCRPEHPSH